MAVGASTVCLLVSDQLRTVTSRSLGEGGFLPPRYMIREITVRPCANDGGVGMMTRQQLNSETRAGGRSH